MMNAIWHFCDYAPFTSVLTYLLTLVTSKVTQGKVNVDLYSAFSRDFSFTCTPRVHPLME